MPFVNIKITKEGATRRAEGAGDSGSHQSTRRYPGQEPPDHRRAHRGSGHRQLGHRRRIRHQPPAAGTAGKALTARGKAAALGGYAGGAGLSGTGLWPVRKARRFPGKSARLPG